MLARDCFEKALRGPAVHRLYAVFWRKRGDAQLLAKKAEIDRKRVERNARIHAAWTAEDARRAADGARRQAIACDILRAHPGARLLRLRPRVRARIAWPAAHWIRT